MQEIVRDKKLDTYRALTLIYIVCVIHVSYWLFPIQFEPYIKGLLLWEMPAIFFIAGASAQMSRKKSIREQIVSRSKRVLLPYYEYALLCLLLLTGLSVLPLTAREISYKITDYNISDFLSVLLAQKIPGVPMVRHLWFVVPYMLVSISFPLQRTWVERYRTKYLLACIIVFVCVEQLFRIIHIDYFQYHWILRFVVFNIVYFACYNIFFIAGFLFYKKIRKKHIVMILITSLLIFIILTNGRITDMQGEKFPPTSVFVSFSTVWLCLLGFVKIPALKGTIMNRWNSYGFTMYLYQNFAFLIFHFTAAQVIPQVVGWGFLGFIISVIALFIISTLLSYITVPYESFMSRFVLKKCK